MNDYPSKGQLQGILDFTGTPEEFIEYINSIWWSSGFIIKNGYDHHTHVKRCFISTWGWSGNEDIIEVLKKTWFWAFWWKQSNRGGHYIFEIPTKQWWGKKQPFEYGLPGVKITEVNDDYEI